MSLDNAVDVELEIPSVKGKVPLIPIQFYYR